VTITPFHFVMAAPSMLVLAALVALGLLVPIKLIAFVVGVTVSQATAGLIRRDLPLFKRLLPVGALAILLARWLW
jgi:hypothetical protein